MNWKKISIWIISILILGFTIEFGFKSWIKNSLPSFINEKNDTPYNFNYSDVSYSLLSRQMTVSGIYIFPKTKDKGIYQVKVEKIIVHGVHFFSFLSKKDLIADLIEIDNPDITINRNFDSINQKKEVKTYSLGNSIQIGNFVINKGNLQLFNVKTRKKMASLRDFNLNLAGVIWNMADKEKRIPISYKNAKLDVKDIFYQLNDIHHLNVSKLKFDNGYIEADLSQIIPDITENQFYSRSSVEKSFMNIQVPAAKINGMDWGYDNNGIFYVNTSKIEVDSTNIRILGRSNNNQPSKNVTAYVDRIIPFNLKIDSIQILKSKLNMGDHIISDNINIIIRKINNKVDDKISVEQLKLYNTLVSVYQQKISVPPSSHPRSNFTYYFDDILELKNFSIQNSDVKYFNINKANVLSMSNINYNMNNIVINTLITNIKKELPFTYNSYSLNGDSIFYIAPRNYTFKVAKVDLTNDAFSASKLEIIPKISPVQFVNQNFRKNLFKVAIDNISIPKINWKIEDNKLVIQISSIIVNTMNADLFKNKNYKKIVSKKSQSRNSGSSEIKLDIGTFHVANSSLNQYDARSGQSLIKSKGLDITLKNIAFNDGSENTTFGLPFSFNQFAITGKNVLLDIGYHNLTLNNFLLTQNSLAASGLTVKPKESQNSVMRKKGIDAYTLSLSKIEIPKLDLGLPNKDIQLISPQINIYTLAATIHQYDIPNSQYIPVSKYLFNKKLRNMNFKLQVGQINLKNSYLSYEEESLDKNVGKIYFSDINAQIKNVNSGYKASSLPDVSVDFNSKFMYSANLSALWKFNVLSLDDSFTVKGKLSGLSAEKINMFIKPYLNVSADGTFDDVVFNYKGNNDKGNGTFGMNYKDLNVTIYKKNGTQEKKLLTNLANLVVKENTKDSLTISNIKEVERFKDKSFFNFLWKLTLSGLKNTLLIF